MFAVVKVFISAGVIAFVSWLAGRKPVLAGFLTALPLVSMLAILFAYYQNRDMQKIDAYATSILVAVPLSLVFFVPFVLNRWLRLDFAYTYLIACGLLVAAYFVHTWIFKHGA